MDIDTPADEPKKRGRPPKPRELARVRVVCIDRNIHTPEGIIAKGWQGTLPADVVAQIRAIDEKDGRERLIVVAE